MLESSSFFFFGFLSKIIIIVTPHKTIDIPITIAAIAPPERPLELTRK